MRGGFVVAVVAVIGGIAIACGSGGSDGGASSSGGASTSSGGSSSGTTSGSSSGTTSGSSSGASTSTVCTPMLAAGFFDSATAVDGATFGSAPCPPGFHAKPVSFQPFPASFPEPVRYSTQQDFVAARCDADDAGAADAGGVSIDFATHDLVVVLVAGIGVSTEPLLSRGGELWVRRKHRQCGGAQDMVNDAYYVVGKGEALHVESCTTTCVACMAP